ncbi:ShlB/FhaC/HecB family hemolysin secretion/activation protein [Sphingomonas sp. RT2P30]|uniref:ShlB/FhaC/HecB family hemolysin secretion/activation protein n=1 Tax=Parasphingomonas halimpatiens TaxID=3096162 RepID=UPI002FC8E706
MIARYLSCGVLAMLAVGNAHAQTVPGSSDPARLGDRFRPPETPQATPEIRVQGDNATAPPEQATDTHFTLSAVTIDGSTVYAAADFTPLYQSMLGHDVTIADIYRLRDSITAKYRAAGYILSQAIVPPQKIEGGVVHIQIVEGSIGAVTIEGDGGNTQLVSAMVDRIKRSSPLNARDLERYTLLIDDLPGVSVSTILKPSVGTPGNADLVVTITRKMVEGFASSDNRGSQAIGPFEFATGLSFNSVLGLNEQASVLLATTAPTRELRYVSGKYAQVLNPEGLRLDLAGSYSRSQPGGSLHVLDARGFGTILSVALSEPVIRSRSQTLRIGASFTYQNSRTDLLGFLFSQDRVRYATARVSYDFSDLALGNAYPAANLVELEINHGFDILGASRTGSPTLSRANGHSDFTTLAGELSRVQRLGPQLSLAASVSGQFAFDPLLSSQQFGLGGRRYGRGYEPSELTGDKGLAVSIEPRFDLPRGALPFGVQLYAFYEVGKVWAKAPLAGQPGHESLSSAGGGVRLSIASHVSADFELAKPLTHDIASRGDRSWRPLFDVSVSF